MIDVVVGGGGDGDELIIKGPQEVEGKEERGDVESRQTRREKPKLGPSPSLPHIFILRSGAREK